MKPNRLGSVARAVAESPRAAGFLIGLVLGAAYLGVRFESLQGIGESVDHSPGLMHDFSMYFYRTGKSLMAGGGPVGGFLYPPTLGILMMPFSLLSLADARFLWGILEALAILALTGISGRMAPPRIGWVALATAATLLSTPVLHNFKWGQLGVPLTVLGLLGAEAIGARRLLSVVLISLVASIKLYPAVLFSVFLRRRDGKALLASAACVAALVFGAPGLVLGLRRMRRFFEKVAPFLSATADTTDPNSQSVSHWLTRSFDAPPEGLVMGLAALMALISAALLRGARSSDARTLDRFTAFLSLAWIPFVVPTCWANYFAFLPPLAAFLARQGDALPPGGRRLVHASSVAVLLAGSFVSVDLIGGWRPYVAEGVLLLADLLAALTALGILAVRTWERPRAAAPGPGAPPSDRVGDLLEA